MIGALKGTALSVVGERILVDVNGVGYEVTATAAVLANAKLEEEIRLTVYTDVKENAITLFGFYDGSERELFLLLRRVKGIGSKTALAVISVLGSKGMLSAIGTGDLSMLQRVPGIGKKSAERILVELREQVQSFIGEARESLRNHITIHKVDIGAQGGIFSAYGSLAGAAEDAALALERLGFPAERASQVVKQIVSEGDVSGEAEAGEIVQRALAALSR